jgi:hypothetical protein
MAHFMITKKKHAYRTFFFRDHEQSMPAGLPAVAGVANVTSGTMRPLGMSGERPLTEYRGGARTSA